MKTRPASRPAKAVRLSLTVQYAVKPEFAPTRPQFRVWARAALRSQGELTIRLVGEEEGLALNRDYRGKAYATNVLTFVYDDLPPQAGVMGDLVLCPAVVAREAAGQGKRLEAHYAHLVVHGMLHLQGYDHEAEAEAQAMEALERQIVTSLGYPDPYAGDT